MTRIYARDESVPALALGLMTGPLWCGWLLGGMVIAWPGAPLWVYSLGATLVPLLLFVLGRRPAPAALRPHIDGGLVFGVFAAGCVFFIAFNNAMYPRWEHDVLIVEALVQRLRESWDFWALPRYVADDTGFFHPLAHPPAMMTLEAWISSYAPWGIVTRIPSAYACVAIFAGMYLAAERFLRGAGVWAVFLGLSASSFVFFLSNNSQDIYRHAALAAALVAFAAGSTQRAAIVWGALCGLAATYHSLGLIFVALLPAAAGLVSVLRRELPRAAAAAMFAGGVVAAYPYVSNLRHVGRLTIPTQSMHVIPNVLAVMRDAISARSGGGGFMALAAERLPFLTERATWGFVGIAFAFAVAGALVLRRVRIEDRSWLALCLAGCGFMLLVVDPGDLVFRFTRYRLAINPRYPMAMLPVLAVAAAPVLHRFASVAGKRGAWVLTALALFALGYQSRDHFKLDAKLLQEPGQACHLCADEEQLRNSPRTSVFRAIEWLEQRNTENCLTLFTEAPYFAWSRLHGVPYYHGLASEAFGQPDAEHAISRLREAGVNCVLLSRSTDEARALSERFPAFWSLRTAPNVLVVPFADVEVWLLRDHQVERADEMALKLPDAPVRVYSFDLPAFELGEVKLTVWAAAPFNVVTYRAESGRRYRLQILRGFSGGEIAVPLVGTGAPVKFDLWFSQAVTISSATYSPIYLR